MIVKVVAALIENDGKYLIAKRSTGDPNNLGKWEFPGGKVQDNETDECAIEREINEEFELVIEANDFVSNTICEYPTKTIDLRLYKCKYIRGEFNLHDHSEYKWVSIDEMMNYDLAKADIELVKSL